VTYLDDALPVWHWCETYGRRVDAPPQDALAAFLAVTLNDMALTRLLMTLRDLPSALLGRRRHEGIPGEGPSIDRMLDSGFCNLGENPGRELAVGIIDQSWKFDGGERAQVNDVAEFTAYDRPGFVKIGVNFLATPLDGGTFLSIQTRILATDERTRRIFGAYWVFIRPFSGLTRKAWLEAAQRRLDE
jgi:hypothetical protein